MDISGDIPSRVFDGDRLSHAYIAGGGLADAIAVAAVCSGQGARPCMQCVHCGKAMRGVHPDIAYVDKLKDKREILVEQIRDLKKDVIVVPGEAARKAYVINSADAMNVAAQNAFLQILEEPPPHAVFVLKTENPAALLPTVRSRCLDLKTKAGSVEVDAAAADAAREFFAALERGNAALVRFMFKIEKLDRIEFSAFLSAASEMAAEKLRGAASVGAGRQSAVFSNVERALYKAGEYMDLNVSTGHISGMICAALVASG